MLNSDNSPTDLYSKFKSDSSRAEAALSALKLGFKEIFKRNEYANKLTEDRVRDIVVEITGLNKNDQVVGAIMGTFNAFNQFAKEAQGNPEPRKEQEYKENTLKEVEDRMFPGKSDRDFNLVNTINVVLPETTDIQVYNAIFKSIRENLLN